MRLLDQYILRQLGLPLMFCMVGFLIFLVSGDILAQLEDFTKLGIHPVDILTYYLLKAPGFLELLAPVAFLLSLLYGLIQMTRFHETTAMRAAGISLWRIAAPIFAGAIFLGILSFAYREIWSVEFETRARGLLQPPPTEEAGLANRGGSARLYYYNEAANRRWDIDSLKSSDASEIAGVNVQWRSPDGLKMFLWARQGKYESPLWVFQDVQLYASRDGDMLPQKNQKLDDYSVTTEILPETPEFLLSQLKVSQIDDIREARDTLFNIREITILKKSLPTMSDEYRALIDTKLHSQISGAFKFLVVALIAVPLGCRPGRRDAFLGVAVCMGVCFSYFVIERISVPMGITGKMLPWLAAWLPNIIFGGTGIFLMVRANRV